MTKREKQASGAVARVKEQGYKKYLWLLAAVVITVLFLSPTLNNDWVNWDDPGYVEENPLVKELSVQQVAEIFTTPQVKGTYCPLVILSLGVNYAISGMEPFGYHLTNMLLHLLNVILIFWFIYLLSGRSDMATISAMLFGVHPMHVEAVAWISARKDVLYALFFLAALISYMYYLKAEKRKTQYYWLCLILFVLSLLSKGMAVVLPPLLLLIDYLKERTGLIRLVREKVPFFLISLIFGIVAVVGQQQGDALDTIDNYSFGQFVFIAFYGMLMYLVKVVAPFHLSAFYPYPPQGHYLPWYFYAAALPVLLVIYTGGRAALKNRKIAFGLGFFLICIGPVLQLFPVGMTIMTERFTYIAYIGLFYLIALAFVRLMEWAGSAAKRYVIQGGMVIYIATMGVLAWKRSVVWYDGETLWTDVIKKYPKNFLGYSNRAYVLRAKGLDDRALDDLNKSISLKPDEADAYNNRGMIYQSKGENEKALRDFTRSIERDSSYVVAYINRAVLAMNMGRRQAALSDLNKGVALDPNQVLGYLNRGLLYLQMGKPGRALEDISRVIAIDPGMAAAWYYRGIAYAMQKDLEAALQDLNKALLLKPDYREALFWRSRVQNDRAYYREAKQDALHAQRLGHPVSEAYLNSLNDE